MKTRLIIFLFTILTYEGFAQHIIGGQIEYVTWTTNYDPLPNTWSKTNSLRMYNDTVWVNSKAYELYELSAFRSQLPDWIKDTLNPDSKNYSWNGELLATEDTLFIKYIYHHKTDSFYLLPFYCFNRQIGDTFSIYVNDYGFSNYVVTSIGATKFINGLTRSHYKAESLKWNGPFPITVVKGFGTLEFGINYMDQGFFETGSELMLACSNDDVLFKEGLEIKVGHDSSCNLIRYVSIPKKPRLKHVRIINSPFDFPNVSIDSDVLPLTISVYDQSGKKVIREIVNNKSWIMSHKHLKHGLYLIRVIDNAGNEVTARVIR